MALINLTPHDIIVVSEAQTITLPSQGVCRVSSTSVLVGEHEGTPLYKVEFGQVEGLPDQVDGVLYIVSALVKSAVPHRNDVVSPTEYVRDSEGRIIGCKGFSL